MMTIFSRCELYPNDLADGIEEDTIYHGVNKKLLTGLIAYTQPYYGIILECNIPLETNPWDDLTTSDDTIILAESKLFLWLFWTDWKCGYGSVGKINKQKMNNQTLQDLVIKAIYSLSADRIPKQNYPHVTGNYREIPVNKQIVF